MTANVKSSVQLYWDASPCGTKFADAEPGTPTFFQEVERHRYGLEPHILELAPFAKSKDKKVLEIGSGLGTDGVQFAKGGARYSAIDLSPKSLEMARKNFEWRGLRGNFQVGDSENIPFADNTFDYVYSHGVIHHTPNMPRAVQEIHRVLKPGGQAVIMVYHKNSLNYYLGIQGVRKAGALLLYVPGGVELVHQLTGEKRERLQAHRDALRKQGLGYLTGAGWLPKRPSATSCRCLSSSIWRPSRCAADPPAGPSPAPPPRSKFWRWLTMPRRAVPFRRRRLR